MWKVDRRRNALFAKGEKASKCLKALAGNCNSQFPIPPAPCRYFLICLMLLLYKDFFQALDELGNEKEYARNI